MDQNLLIIIFVVELLVFYLIIYGITRLNRKICEKQAYIDEIFIELPEFFHELKSIIKGFNSSINKKVTVKPFSQSELNSFIGGIANDFLKYKFPLFFFNKSFLYFNLIFKFWSNKQRILATLSRGLSKSDGGVFKFQ